LYAKKEIYTEAYEKPIVTRLGNLLNVTAEWQCSIEDQHSHQHGRGHCSHGNGHGNGHH
jgi:hypothetical protein